MSAFNTVHANVKCPSCGQQVEIMAQFKYGDTWQYEYSIGDLIRWGGNQIGAPGARRAVVDAVVERCPSCNMDSWDLYVEIDDGRIASVTTADGSYDFVRAGKTYVILDE